MKYDVCVVGLGYIGLPSALFFASNGLKVAGIDSNNAVVHKLSNNELHIYEPGLDALFEQTQKTNAITFGSEYLKSDVYIVCVPTPFSQVNETLEPDISYLEDVFGLLASHLKGNELIIVESTSPVGTTAKLAAGLAEANALLADVDVAYCPERVLPGKIIEELKHNNRVIGGVTPKAAKRASAFYRPLIQGDIFKTDAATAEMCKLAENSYRDVNIAFANELSRMAHEAKVNVRHLISLANMHPRVDILQPGIGVGGHCIAVDPWFLISRFGESATLLKKARETNLSKTLWVEDQILNAHKRRGLGLDDPIVILGLSYKQDIDDVRESPSVQIAENLIDKGYPVLCVEPNIGELDEFRLIEFSQIPHARCTIAITQPHSHFRRPESISFLKDMDAMDFCGLF